MKNLFFIRQISTNYFYVGGTRSIRDSFHQRGVRPIAYENEKSALQIIRRLITTNNKDAKDPRWGMKVYDKSDFEVIEYKLQGYTRFKV